MAAKAGIDVVLKDVSLEAAEKGQQLRNAGKLISARERFLVCQAPTCPAIVREDCTKWIGEVADALPTVVVSVHDERGLDVFDADAQQPLIDSYLVRSSGKPPVPPALLAMVLILQGALHVSDEEAVERILAVRAAPRTLDEYVAEETAQRLAAEGAVVLGGRAHALEGVVQVQVAGGVATRHQRQRDGAPNQNQRRSLHICQHCQGDGADQLRPLGCQQNAPPINAIRQHTTDQRKQQHRRRCRKLRAIDNADDGSGSQGRTCGMKSARHWSTTTSSTTTTTTTTTTTSPAEGTPTEAPSLVPTTKGSLTPGPVMPGNQNPNHDRPGIN